MKLRYTVEGKFAATFTSTKNVKTEDEANKTVISLKILNHKEGYAKYSNFILYGAENIVLIKYSR